MSDPSPAAESSSPAAPPSSTPTEDELKFIRLKEREEATRANIEALKEEHSREMQRLVALQRQVEDMTALSAAAAETKEKLARFLVAVDVAGKAAPKPSTQLALTRMALNLWEAALTLQKGNLHSQAAEIFATLLPHMRTAHQYSNPPLLARCYIATATSLTALGQLPDAERLVAEANEIEKESRKAMIRRNLGLCAADGCKAKGLNHCARCGTVQYCSKDCQKSDWAKRHKHQCKASS